MRRSRSGCGRSSCCASSTASRRSRASTAQSRSPPALTATIPLAIVVSAVATQLGGKGIAERVIERYERPAVAPKPSKTSSRRPPVLPRASDSSDSSSARRGSELHPRRAAAVRTDLGAQPLSVRNTLNGLLWIGGLGAYLAVSGFLHTTVGRRPLELTAALLLAPLTAVFLLWSASVLSAGRLERRDLIPFAILGALLLALYSVGAAVYVPHLFDTYATRYGVIGASSR